MSSLPSSSPFDDLLRELDELPSASPAAPPRDQNKEIAMQKLMDASKLLETVAASLDPSDPKHPLHGVTLPDEAKRRLQSIVQHLVGIQQQLNEIEGEILDEGQAQGKAAPPSHEELSLPNPLENDLPPLPKSDTLSHAPEQTIQTPPTSPAPVPPTSPPPPAAPSGPSAAYLAAKTKLDEERKAFDAYKQQWEAVFATDPTQRDGHPEVLAYYKQMEQYFIDHEAYLKTL